ncbi:MAG TPA: hypothetical protein VMS88_02240 [Terriglobales bacterium]|nr:hypothetical protein [Terriglobales bacterium]
MNDRDLIGEIAGRIPGRPDPRLRAVWIVLFVLGVAAFVYLLATEPLRAWGAYGANLVFFLGVSLGAGTLAAAIRLSNGRWAASVVRIAESLTAYLPYGLALLVVMLAIGIWRYLPWTHGLQQPRQAPFLNVPFLYMRTLAGFGLLWWLVHDMVRASLRRDLHLLRDRVSPELRTEYDRLAGNWTTDAEERRRERDRLAQRSAQVCVVFAIVFTVFAWDFIMALTPTWVSPLFGWWVFMGAFLNGIAMTGLLATRLRARRRLEEWVTPDHFQDVGRLLFAFSIFWVYLFWSQYLVIWYGNIPEETWWVFLRFEDPWRRLAFSVFGLVFLIPFVFVMNAATKRSPFWLALFSLVVLVGMWLERHLLIMPSLHPERVWLGLPEIGVGLGFLGIFGFAVQRFLARYPAVKLTQLLEAREARAH